MLSTHFFKRSYSAVPIGHVAFTGIHLISCAAHFAQPFSLAR
ncbi:hypothetical protein BMETH_850_0 [methanotrophic bacterial endosymbiont of Bathymodiolus sp.]|nr:hypothetical protein BMETH_850_0 [methanotrophic bacterial endosymbiont of Bathymodiolus sp.]